MSNVTGLTLGTQPTFPPMYYDSPATQTVLEFAVTAADSLMAAITAGATYFKVVSLASFKLEETPILPPPPTLPGGVRPQAVSDAAGKTSLVQVASSNGTTPLSVMSGQTVRLTLTAEVPKGTSLAPGKFTGAATVTGKTTKEAVNLAGTYLGTLMGKVTVTPATVVPGQSVQVQVLDASGKVVSDPTVTVLIQGTAATSRYYQFAAVGTYPFYVVASRGALTETTSVNVVVAGNAMAFRASLVCRWSPRCRCSRCRPSWGSHTRPCLRWATRRASGGRSQRRSPKRRPRLRAARRRLRPRQRRPWPPWPRLRPTRLASR